MRHDSDAPVCHCCTRARIRLRSIRQHLQNHLDVSASLIQFSSTSCDCSSECDFKSAEAADWGPPYKALDFQAAAVALIVTHPWRVVPGPRSHCQRRTRVSANRPEPLWPSCSVVKLQFPDFAIDRRPIRRPNGQELVIEFKGEGKGQGSHSRRKAANVGLLEMSFPVWLAQHRRQPYLCVRELGWRLSSRITGSISRRLCLPT